ncbi:hypothetical protein JB92DRAFT_2736972, partial [Gautieria morchelliformis]
YRFCAGYGNLIKLSNAYISASYGLMMSAVISVIVQWFFCYRICSLSKSWLLASLIAAVRICFSSTHIVLRHVQISLMQGVASLIIGIRVCSFLAFVLFNSLMSTGPYCWEFLCGLRSH